MSFPSALLVAKNGETENESILHGCEASDKCLWKIRGVICGFGFKCLVVLEVVVHYRIFFLFA